MAELTYIQEHHDQEKESTLLQRNPHTIVVSIVLVAT